MFKDYLYVHFKKKKKLDTSTSRKTRDQLNRWEEGKPKEINSSSEQRAPRRG